MTKIRFLSDQVYDTGAPGKGPAFAAGSTLSIGDVGAKLGVEVSDEYAAGFLQRWVNRNVAVFDDGTDAPDVGQTTDADEGIVYSDLTRAELDALAAKRGVDISDAKNKGDVIAALELSDET